MVRDTLLRLIVGCVSLAWLTTGNPAEALAQGTRSVRGTVIERGSRKPIAEAVVHLGDDLRTVTDERGEFTFQSVRPGSYGIVVEAYGYNTARLVLAVDGTADVGGTIELDPAPIPLDTLAVSLRTATIRGRVVDEASGARAAFVTVYDNDTGATTTNDGGGFALRDLPIGVHDLRVVGFGWLPRTVEVDLVGDTTLSIGLKPDSIALRGIAVQVGVLGERSRSVGVALRVLPREDIARSLAPTPLEYLKSRGVPIRQCSGMSGRLCIGSQPAAVWIDEISSCLEILRDYPMAALERIEVIGVQRNTIRAYTRWFIQRMTEGRVRLQPITPYDRPIIC